MLLLKILALLPLFFISTLPGAFAAKAVMKRRGQDLPLLEAPMRFMMSASTPQQLGVVALNLSVFGGFIYLLFWVCG